MNTSILFFFCAFLRFISLFLPPAFLSPSLVVVSPPSICHPQPVSASSKRFGFQNGAFLLSFFGSPVMLPEFVSWKKNCLLYIREERYKDERRCTNPLIHRNVEVQFTVLISILLGIQNLISGSVMTRL